MKLLQKQIEDPTTVVNVTYGAYSYFKDLDRGAKKRPCIECDGTGKHWARPVCPGCGGSRTQLRLPL